MTNLAAFTGSMHLRSPVRGNEFRVLFDKFKLVRDFSGVSIRRVPQLDVQPLVTCQASYKWNLPKRPHPKTKLGLAKLLHQVFDMASQETFLHAWWP